MRYLTAQQLLLIHSRLIDQTGGSAGVRDQNRIKSVIEAPKQAVFGQEQYATVFKKATVYIRNIIYDHPFVDGNKRTAMLSGLTFLDLNGYTTDCKPGEIEKLAVRIATKKITINEITGWLEKRAKK